jgi:hypothetical protein
MDFLDDLMSDGTHCGRPQVARPESWKFKKLPGDSASDYASVAIPTGMQNWGRGASSWSTCDGKIIGFKQRVESSQGWGDDTSLNAVRFLCDSDHWISSLEQHWGSWSSTERCPGSSYITGLRIKSESGQGSGDDTAANSVRPICSDGTELKADREGEWGNWHKVTCPEGFHVRGFRTLVEPSQGGGDDTALNSILLLCIFDYGEERLAAVGKLRRSAQDIMPPRMMSEDRPFTIAVAGDVQLGKDGHDKDANTLYRNTIQYQADDGIILVGDLTNAADKEEWCDFDDVWHSVKTWPMTGNHDWMYGDSLHCSSFLNNGCFLSPDDFMETRGEFMKWWMKRLLTDSAFTWPNFGGADSWSSDSLAYSFVKEGVRFVLLNEHPLATREDFDGYKTPSMQFLESELRLATQPTVLVIHFPPTTEDGCEEKYAWCSKASQERLASLLARSQVVAIVSGHIHERSGIWDWSPVGNGHVENFWGNKIKLMHAGAVSQQVYPVHGRRWLKISSSKCQMVFTVMEGASDASECKDVGYYASSCVVKHEVQLCGEEVPQMVCLDVQLYTRDWGHENSWELKSSDSDILCSEDPGHCGSYDVCAKRCCIPSTKLDSLSLTLRDSYGDAWHGGSLLINNAHLFTLASPNTYRQDYSNLKVASCAVVVVDAKHWFNEMSWTIGECSGSVTRLGKNEWTCCRRTGLAWVFLHDSYGDGWHGGSLTVLGQVMGSTFLSGHFWAMPIYWS